MTSNELADWMEKNNVPALLTHYMHGVKDQRYYEPFKGLADGGVAMVKVTLKRRDLTMEATETFETELKVAQAQIESLKEDVKTAEAELNKAKKTVTAQEKEISSAENEIKRLKAEAKKKAASKVIPNIAAKPKSGKLEDSSS